MPAFTDLAGIPMTANVPLLKGWLREQAGFDGVIVSDYNAIAELIHHGVAADLAQAATLALKAGVDIDMMAGAYRHGLPVALDRGWVSVEEIDASVRRVLTLKLRLGLFDDPYRRGSAAQRPAALAARRRLARSVGARAIVLLKNAEVFCRCAAVCSASQSSAPSPTQARKCAALGGVPRRPTGRSPSSRVCAARSPIARCCMLRESTSTARISRGWRKRSRCARRRTPSCCAWAKRRG